MKFFRKTIFLTLLLTASQNLWAADQEDGKLDLFSRSISQILKLSPFKRNPAVGAIISKAEELSKFDLFKQNTNNLTIKVKTTLGKILEFHDDLSALIIKAQGNNISLEVGDVFSKDVFEALQGHEKSLRKMIHLIWGVLMIDPKCAEDVEAFMKPKSSPFLFNGRGFEAVDQRRTPPKYSFHDENNSTIHVDQIRKFVEILQIDCNAPLDLPFDPKVGLRKEMVKTFYQSQHTGKKLPSTESEKHKAAVQFHSYMLNTLKIRNDMEDQEDTSIDSSSSSDRTKINLDSLKSARNRIKFESLMKTNGSDNNQIKIIRRLTGSTTEADLSHRDLLSVPYGAALKPTTITEFNRSQTELGKYLERTNGILANAEEIARSGSVTIQKNLPLSNKVQQLMGGALQVVRAYDQSHSGTKWSDLVTKMLENLCTSRSGPATYVGDISELRDLLPVNTVPQYLFNNEAETGMYALEALVKEFKEKSSS